MAWGDLDPDNDGFTTTQIVCPYKGGFSWQKLQQIAKNTSYNYRRCDQRLFIFNESFTYQQEKDFDTGFDYRNNIVQIIIEGTTAGQSLPIDIDVSATEIRYLAMLTTYQAMANGSYFDIKALATGGFRIKNSRYNGTRYMTASVFELRLVTGT